MVNVTWSIGEWVTCRQYSILISQYESLVHLKCYILIQDPSQLVIWLQRYKHSSKIKSAMLNIWVCQLFKSVTQNPYSRHPIHSPWSYHTLECVRNTNMWAKEDILNIIVLSQCGHWKTSEGMEGSGVTGGGGGQGESTPLETSDWEIFADVSGEKKQGKKGKGVKIEEKEGKLLKGRWKIGNGSRKSYKKWWGTFFFFAFHFWIRRKFVLGLPKWEFLPRKNISRREKIRKNDFAPSEKYACYAPDGETNHLGPYEF